MIVRTLLAGSTFFLPFSAILIAKDSRILKGLGIAYFVASIIIILTV